MRLVRALGRALRLLAHLVKGLRVLQRDFPRLTVLQRLSRVQAWSAQLLQILGVELEVVGVFPSPQDSVLVVANHVSWLDVAALHAVLPQVRFVAKAAVHHWPVVGPLCRAGRTLYIERQRKRDAMRVVHEMANALRLGDSVAVFPEATTADGHALKPFHANLLQAAIVAERVVFPVALRFSDPQHAISPAVEYVGDTSLLRSVCRILWASQLKVSVLACEPVVAVGAERRALAQECRALIESRLSG